MNPSQVGKKVGILTSLLATRLEGIETSEAEELIAPLCIKGGEPVIRGTRIGVRAVAQRIERGDTVQTLTEDYPHVLAEAFETAYTYAKARPRRGRPARPWRDGDKALDRRGPDPCNEQSR